MGARQAYCAPPRREEPSQKRSEWALARRLSPCELGRRATSQLSADDPSAELQRTSAERLRRPCISPRCGGWKHEDGSMLKRRPSALSTAGLAAIAILGALLPRPAVATPTFIQGVAFSTPRIPSTTVTLTHPVAQGDLLVGWFSQYNAPGEFQVSDNVNGTWTRVAAGALTFDDDTGDIALYYRENSRAAPGGITLTVSASSAAYLQGAVAEYSGLALAGALDQIAAGHAEERTPVDTGPTPAVGAGELVFAALMTDVSGGSVTPGSSQGVRYTARAQN